MVRAPSFCLCLCGLVMLCPHFALAQMTPELWADLRNNAAAFQCSWCQQHPQVFVCVCAFACELTWPPQRQPTGSGTGAVTAADDDEEEVVQPLPLDVDVDALLEEEQRRSGHPIRPLISVVPSGAGR